MSLLRPALNRWLRLTERRFMERAEGPEMLREAFERKARFWFRAPRGTKVERRDLAGHPALWVQAPGAAGNGAIFYLHGGGYFFGSPHTHKAMLARLSALTGLPVCLPFYGLAPEHPFPAGFEDALAAYRALAEGQPAGARLVLGGDSAGGGLALALLAELGRAGLRRPDLAFAFSPWTDLTLSGASLRGNADSEAVLPVGRLAEVRDEYLNGAPAEDPRATPLFADFTGAGPVALYASDSEVFLDDTRRMAAALRAQGVPVTERIEAGLPHVWPIFHNYLPEARATLADLAGRISAALQA